MTTDRDELMALIKRQPPMSAGRFRKQVEKARRLSPNVETLRIDGETKRKKKSNAPNSTGAWMIWSRTRGTT